MYGLLIRGGFRGGGGDVRPPPPKIGPKKKKCFNFAIFPHLVVKKTRFARQHHLTLLSILPYLKT